SYAGSVLDAAAQYDIVTKSGAWVIYQDEKLGQGMDNARLFLKENPKILSKIEKETRAKAEESS
ncbi:MAG: hypothetical protein HQ547_00400, partial [Candidatus Omnitrophica bacterium]|nr:hypothetical protein [Candidatus Omnitrophota bacterium]